MVTSPTSRRARGGHLGWTQRLLRPGIVAAVTLALLAGLAPAASAEDLDDARDRLRKELSAAKKEIAADKTAVTEAAAELADSRQALSAARTKLAADRDELADAKAADAAVAADLKAAEAAAEAAAAAVVAAEQRVAEQEVLIGVAVRSAYQQQNTLVGLSVLLGSDDPNELAQRLQWSTTIFDNSTAELDRLTELRADLARAKAASDAAEAELAAKREASAEHLAKVKRLADAAASQAKKLSGLVAANAAIKAEAEDELEESQADYKTLQAQEARLSAKIKAAERKFKLVNTGGFIRPVNAAPGSPFGLRFHPILHYWRMHWGTDFGAACGAPIRAMADGRVISAGWTTIGFGNFTVISYGKVKGAYVSSGYAHQSKVVVRAGEKVKQGQIVGYVGTTGLSTGCHLHLQIYRDGVRVNPMRYL